jgi:hypothetical protein
MIHTNRAFAIIVQTECGMSYKRTSSELNGKAERKPRRRPPRHDCSSFEKSTSFISMIHTNRAFAIFFQTECGMSYKCTSSELNGKAEMHGEGLALPQRHVASDKR